MARRKQAYRKIATVANPTIEERKSEYNQREAKDQDGLYTALSSTWTPKQLATYVVISCNVTYNSTIDVNDNGVNEGTTTSVYRTGFAEYTVHLGYIGNDANDFNSYRNCNYTYNLTVNGLNDIVVEANDGVERNAAEGTVIDVETRSIDLDSHFHAFNIALTGEELNARDNDGKSLFGFIMSTSQKDYRTENDIQYTFTDLDNPYDPTGRTTVPEYLYNWIEIKEAPSQTELAQFIPAKGGNFNDNNRVVSFAQFTKEVQENKRTFDNSRTYYFTIFVNEYTYDLRFGEDGYGDETKTPKDRNWQTYINQAPRSFIIRVRRKLSADGNSIYARSKYAIQQSSVQSYYDTQTATEGTAVGIEHVNETQGLNLFQYEDGTSAENGRYNVYNTLLKSL